MEVVNKQNCRILGWENPCVIHKQPIQSLRVLSNWVVWLMSSRYHRAVFLWNDIGERYRDMLWNFLFPYLEQEDMNSIGKMALCVTQGENRFIAYLFFWPCDFQNWWYKVVYQIVRSNAPRFFLFFFLKDKLYENNPQTIKDIKDNICLV